MHHGTDITGLLGVDDVDQIVSGMALRAPAFRMVKGGQTIDAGAYTRRARIGSRPINDLIDVGRVYALFDDGATIVLQGLHRYWTPVGDLCRRLEDVLTHPLQANAYITPPVAQGLDVHADAHDVFAIQTHGRKQWVVYEGNQQPEPDGSGGTPTMDAQLWPGDCLYLPKGTHHAARTVDSSSIHLTLGVRTVTWADVLRPAIDRVLDDPALTAALPAGFAADPESLTPGLLQRLGDVAAAVTKSDAPGLAQNAARRFRRQRVPSLTGQLQQLFAAENIEDRTRVRRRPYATVAVEDHPSSLLLILGDRTLRFPASAGPAVQAVLERQEFVVYDLAEYLDEAGRLTLVRRLMREGLLMVADG